MCEGHSKSKFLKVLISTQNALIRLWDVIEFEWNLHYNNNKKYSEKITCVNFALMNPEGHTKVNINFAPVITMFEGVKAHPFGVMVKV